MPDSPPQTVTLVDLEVGERARIHAIDGGGRLILRLMGLGLRVGSDIRLLQHRGRGVVVSNGETRIALGGNIAQRITAQRAPD